jgi:hypothetical protein
MTTWNESSPAGTAPIGGGDDEIRGLKAAIGERLSREHSFARSGDDPLDGTHELANGLYASRPDADKAGRVYISTDKKLVSFATGAGVYYDLPFAPGTKMVFYQASAPVGWTQDTSQNDKALRVVSGAGGSAGGTSPFSSAWPAQNLSGNTGDESSHIHSVPRAGWGYTSTMNDGVIKTQSSMAQDAAGDNVTGSGSAHHHSVSLSTTEFKPQYIDVIVATKD